MQTLVRYIVKLRENLIFPHSLIPVTKKDLLAKMISQFLWLNHFVTILWLKQLSLTKVSAVFILLL